MRAEEILKEAQATLIDRGLNYDSDGGERTMDVLVPAFNMITGHSLTRKQGYLFMILLKAARSQQGADKMDNWVDMAAYAGLAGEAE
jgi:hypothetical protein